MLSYASMTIWVRILTTLVLAGFLAGCATAPPVPVRDDGPLVHDIRVVSNGWHTAIIVKHAAVLATGLLPEANDFPAAVFLEFGWGDRVYYPSREKTVGMTLNAAFAASPAVMHVAGLADWPRRLSSDVQVVSLTLSDEGFQSMISAIAMEFQRPESGRAAPVSKGLYGHSHFYNAHGSFHLFNTCNTWTAKTLRAGGVNISPSGVTTADELISRLEVALADKAR